jgi:hypothetical protein
MLTQTHNLGNHSNGYGHSKIALVWSFSGLPESDSSTVLKLENGFELDKDYDF